jgi:drug/metabolite transporter (DMT)-like permease
MGRAMGAIDRQAGAAHDRGMKSTRLLTPIFVLLWSSGYVVGAVALEAAGPLPLLEARYLLASLLTLPFALRAGLPRGVALGRLALLGALLQFVQFVGVYSGVAMGVAPAVAALVMTGLSPLATTALAVASGQEGGDTRLWLGLTVGLAGVGVGLIPELGGASVGAGLALVAIGLAGLAGGTVLQKRWGAETDPLTSVAVQSLTTVALLTPVLAVVGGRFEVGPKLILTTIWLGAGMAVLTMFVLIEMLRRTSASRVGALLLLVPAVTALASAPVLGEALHPLSFVGMAIAGAGVATVLLRRQPVGQPAAAEDEAHLLGVCREIGKAPVAVVAGRDL